MLLCDWVDWHSTPFIRQLNKHSCRAERAGQRVNKHLVPLHCGLRAVSTRCCRCSLCSLKLPGACVPSMQVDLAQTFWLFSRTQKGLPAVPLSLPTPETCTCTCLQKLDLARMFRLFSRTPKGLEPVADAFRRHVEGEGMKLLKEAAAAATAKKEKDAGKPSRDSGGRLYPAPFVLIFSGCCSGVLQQLPQPRWTEPAQPR